MLSGKVAIVSGGSRGIGRAICLALAEAGAEVALLYAGNHQAAEEVVAKIKEQGKEALAIQADISQADRVDAAVKQVMAQYGRIDILVNNAGITRDNLLLRMKEEDWDQVINTNLKGVFLLTKAVVRPMMRQRSGRIINISSVVGVIGNPGQANYASAKAGIIGLTKSVAKEVASRGITVNAIAPGFIDTDMTATLGEEVREQLMDRIPLGRLGNSEDIAGAVKFLASDHAAYITGHTLHVDGGMAIG